MNNPRTIQAGFCTALFISVMGTAGFAMAQTDADWERAKKTYTFEDLQGDALCGDSPTIVWRGGAAAIERGFVKQRLEYADKAPEGKEYLPYNAALVEKTILGMRFAGIAEPSQPQDSVKLAFAAPAAEVFSKLPKSPKMVKVAEAGGVIKWEENKSTRPRFVAFSYKNYTEVMCQRPENFVAKVR